MANDWVNDHARDTGDGIRRDAGSYRSGCIAPPRRFTRVRATFGMRGSVRCGIPTPMTAA